QTGRRLTAAPAGAAGPEDRLDDGAPRVGRRPAWTQRLGQDNAVEGTRWRPAADQGDDRVRWRPARHLVTPRTGTSSGRRAAGDAHRVRLHRARDGADGALRLAGCIRS